MAKKEYNEREEAGHFLKHLDDSEPPRQLTPEEQERLKKAQAELKVIAAAESEEKRKALLEKATDRRHLYHGYSKAGKRHVVESFPDMGFIVVVKSPDGKEIEMHCHSGTQALNVVKNERAAGNEAELIPLEHVQAPDEDLIL